MLCISNVGKLVKPQDAGKQTFIRAFQRRGSCGDVDVFHLSSMIDFDNQCFLDEFTNSVRWHKMCYASYCSERNIESSVQVDISTTAVETTGSSRCTRSKRNPINWKKVCLFCEQTKFRGQSALKRVELEQFWLRLENVCNENRDDDLKLKVGGDFSKPVLEARYHSRCYVTYIKSKPTKSSDVSAHELAFKEFLLYFKQVIDQGRALEMSLLTERYKDLLRKQENVTEIEVLSYRTAKLKAWLENHLVIV